MSDTTNFAVDTTRLEKLIASLTPRRRAALLRSAMRAEANRLKRLAAPLMFQGVRHVRDRRALRRGIRTYAYKLSAGFLVSVKPRKKDNRTFYPSRMASKRFGTRMIPLAMWLEGGADGRRTKKGYARGELKPVRFLARVESRESGSTVRRIEEETVKRLEKLAQRYG